MAEVLNAQVTDQITAMNAKMLADMNQTPMGLSVQNSVANQQSVQAIVNANLQQGLLLGQTAVANGISFAQAVTARAVRFAFDLSAEQATAFSQELGAQLKSELASMGGSLASLQEQAKVANTTPPQTGTGGAFGSDAGSALLQQLGNIQAVLQSLEAKIATIKSA